MTRNKKDSVTGCNFQQYKTNSSTPICKADDVSIKVQGTSSAAYGVAAFNIDTDFSKKMTDANNQPLRYYDNQGKEIEEYRGCWAMRDNSIPVDYTCTKVNVASCENANNAINAEWYHRHQPYHDGHRRKNDKARDCMEFIPGVMFIRDHNVNSTFGGVDQNGNPVEVESAHDQNAYLNIYDGKWETSGHYMTLHRIAVRNGYYKRGIAKELINKTIEIAKIKNVSSIKVDTKETNIRMMNLLIKTGFKVQGKINLLRDGVIDKVRTALEYKI